MKAKDGGGAQHHSCRALRGVHLGQELISPYPGTGPTVQLSASLAAPYFNFIDQNYYFNMFSLIVFNRLSFIIDFGRCLRDGKVEFA